MKLFPAILTTFALGTSMLIGAGTAEAAANKVTQHTFKYNSVKYWRNQAEDAELGSVGRKTKPATQKNFFRRTRRAPEGLYKVHVSARTTISSETASQWDLSGSASNGTVKAGAGTGGSKNYKGTITAYKLVIDLGNSKGALRYETNRAQAHLDAVKDEGGAARLVSAVWIMVEGEENNGSCYSGDLNVGDATGTLSVDVSAEGCKSNSWTIEPGSILAYEMVKVDKWNKKELVERPSCPSGYTMETRSSVATPMDRCVKTTYETSGVECKLLATDKKKNWFVESKSGRDVCKSKKGKKDKEVKCSKSGYDYQVKSGRDSCRKPKETYKDPSCKSGWRYEKRDMNNSGKDQCFLEGIEHLKVDLQEGF